MSQKKLRCFNSSNTKINSFVFFLCACFSIACIFLVKSCETKQKTPYYDRQIEASYLMQKCEAFLYDYAKKNNIEIEEQDINNTALLGPEYSALATTLGDADAKRTILNPNMAALVVKYLEESGLKEGDVVAIGCSGSFPGLALASFCACTAMGLEARIIVSFGSSFYGATRPDFSMPLITYLLLDNGYIEGKLLAISPGSENDYGVGAFEGLLFENTRQTMLDKAFELSQKSGCEFIDLANLKESINRRLELYGDVDLFINIGGASVNTGTSSQALELSSGLVTTAKSIPLDETRGLVFEYLDKGIPVINLLNIKTMVLDNGLPFDPVPLPQVGEGDVYYLKKVSVAIVVLAFLFILTVLGLGVFINKKQG